MIFSSFQTAVFSTYGKH